MNHFGVIGIDKERADRIQKLEEQEDFMIMMAERKNSKALNFDKTVITPFLTWQVCSAPPRPNKWSRCRRAFALTGVLRV